jgi:hypothetical protein
LCIGRGDEEKGGALDEGLVVVGERGARQFVFEPVGDAPAVEAILQVPVAVMVHDAHVCPLRARNSPPFRHDRKIVAARLGGGGEGIVPPYAEAIRKAVSVYPRADAKSSS